jgi:amino-acid N-acetyltransferase
METLTFDEEVESLLAACGLPVSDLQNGVRGHFFGLHRDGELVGVVGIEIQDEFGLLRSLAVSASYRKSGLGPALVAHAEAWASYSGLKALYLLTTTAVGFFERLGYVEMPRTGAPSAITETAQFSGLCPSSATFMGKGLATDNSLDPSGFSAAATKPAGQTGQRGCRKTAR